jgi:hypothetical protein
MAPSPMAPMAPPMAPVVAAILIASLTGCSPTRELTPRLILQGEPVGDEFWLAAPYIVAVRILHADLQGSLQPIFPGGPKSLQLVKFEATVDNVIKGDLSAKTITFFFFTKVDQKPTYYLDPGKRYIVSLRSEGGILRSWADATQLKIEVHSGSHNQQDLPLDRGPAVTIVYILLTPGADCDLDAFANRLVGWPGGSYGDPRYVSERLDQLQRHSNPNVRDSACLEAADIFWYLPKCLDRALQSADNNIREAASKRLNHDDANLPARLRDQPFFLFPKPWTDHMFQWFEILTEDVRPEVRKAACASLQSLAPRRAVERCR